MAYTKRHKHGLHITGSIIMLALFAAVAAALYIITWLHSQQLVDWFTPKTLTIFWCAGSIGSLLAYCGFDLVVHWTLPNDHRAAYEPTIANITYMYAYKWGALLLYVGIGLSYVAFLARNGTSYVVATTCSPDPTCTEMLRWLYINTAASRVAVLVFAGAWFAFTIYVSDQASQYNKRYRQLKTPLTSKWAPGVRDSSVVTPGEGEGGYVATDPTETVTGTEGNAARRRQGGVHVARHYALNKAAKRIDGKR